MYNRLYPRGCARARFSNVKSSLYARLRARASVAVGRPGVGTGRRVWRSRKVHVNCPAHFVNSAVSRSNRGVSRKADGYNAKRQSISLNLIARDGPRSERKVSFAYNRTSPLQEKSTYKTLTLKFEAIPKPTVMLFRNDSYVHACVCVCHM